jgi:hypothetical protein
MTTENLTPAGNSGKPIAPPDPFADVATLRLNPAFAEATGVKKLLATVPARKPNPQVFVRVHPDPSYRENFAMIELKDEREDYLVLPHIVPQLPGEVIYKTVFTAITRQGDTFLWPVRLPAPDDKQIDWWRSAREAAELAMTKWVRVKANMGIGAYDMFIAESEIPEPKWPEESFNTLLRIAYRSRLVDSLDHSVIRRLRGLS